MAGNPSSDCAKDDRPDIVLLTGTYLCVCFFPPSHQEYLSCHGWPAIEGGTSGTYRPFLVEATMETFFSAFGEVLKPPPSSAPTTWCCVKNVRTFSWVRTRQRHYCVINYSRSPSCHTWCWSPLLQTPTTHTMYNVGNNPVVCAGEHKTVQTVWTSNGRLSLLQLSW